MTRIGTLFFTVIIFTSFLIAVKAQEGSNNLPTNSDVKVTEKIKELASPDPLKRTAAACDLKRMGARSIVAVSALIRLLADETEVNSKAMCYEGISPSPSEDFKGLRTPSPGEAAAQALAAIGSPAVETLINTLKDDSWQARKNVAWALALIGDSRALEPLIFSLKDKVWQVRAYAAMALGELRDERVVEPLIYSLKIEETPQVRWFTVASLGQQADGRAFDSLIVSLKNGEHPRERAYAAASLGQIRDRKVVEPLIIALKDKNAQVRMYAAASLGQLRDKRAVKPLSIALKDADAQVRLYARESLNQIRN